MDYSAFSDAGLTVDDAVAAGLKQDGITAPTNIQKAAFRPILEGAPVLVSSGTGTGKTLAYLLPVLERLKDKSSGRTVIFAPATELAIQTLRIAERYKDAELRCGSLVATGSRVQQKARVQKSTRLIVGTPNRILEQFAARRLKGVTTMVIDEPDPVLANTDVDFLKEILSRPDPKVQLIVVGATLGLQAKNLLAPFEDRLVRAEANSEPEDAPLATHIKHTHVALRDGTQKDLEMVRFIEHHKCGASIVFVNQAHLLRHLFRYFKDAGLAPATLSLERGKMACQKALADFKSGRAQVLITTDAAMTGIDIAEVPWVFHYELPGSAKGYVHRAGRTGRAGKQGRSVLFVDDRERAVLRRYEQELDITIREHRQKPRR